MKKWLITLIVGGVLGAAGLLWWQYPGLLPDFFEKKQIYRLQVMRAEMQEVSRLYFAEVHHKLVFPFDFFHPETDWDRVIRSPRRYPEEWKLYQLTREVGLDFINKKEFAVFSLTLQAGWESFNLEDLYISTKRSEGHSELVMYLPLPELAPWTIKDTNPEEYGYPEVPLSPRDMGVLSRYIESKMDPVLEQRVINKAAREAEAFWVSWGKAAGFDRVNIHYGPPPDSIDLPL